MSKQVVLTMTNGNQLNLNGFDDLTIINDAINNGNAIHILNEVVINADHIIHARLEEK